eukprot:scaffold3034_cov173-Amphora_coffeaeformis.AAC.5
MENASRLGNSRLALISFSADVVVGFQKRTMLKGTIPPEVGILKDMEIFLARDMELEGPISTIFSQWPNIKDIRLDQNRLTGKLPTTFGEANPLLEVLDLSENDLTGEIPPSLGSLPNLVTLRLSENNLEGPIPADLINLSRLGKFRFTKHRPTLYILSYMHKSSTETLALSENALTGEIPTGLFALGSIKQLLANENQNITGTIPTVIGQAVQLERLRLGDTEMGGVLPDELFNCSALKELTIQNANFFGTMDADLWSRFTNLEDINLSYNDFSGRLPTEAFAGYTGIEEIKVQGNRFTGTIPQGVCLKRGSGNGDLIVLTVDCNIVCTCCDTLPECN